MPILCAIPVFLKMSVLGLLSAPVGPGHGVAQWKDAAQDNWPGIRK